VTRRIAEKIMIIAMRNLARDAARLHKLSASSGNDPLQNRPGASLRPAAGRKKCGEPKLAGGDADWLPRKNIRKRRG
jgi:hypothetical protein